MFNLAAVLLSGFLAGRCYGEDWNAFRGVSSPVVHGRRVYVTCYSGFFAPGQPRGTQADPRRHLICVERTSGKVLWQRELEAKLPEEERIGITVWLRALRPAMLPAWLYFFGKTGVIAFNHEGYENWRADVGSKTHGWGSIASLVLYGNMVLVNASMESESLRALDRRTGREIWKVDGNKESSNTPVIARSGTGRVDLLLAMKLGGSGDVTDSLRLWTSMKGANVTSPVFHDGHLYFMKDNRESVYCLSAETGEVVCEQRVNRACQVYASALLAGGRSYYLTREGRTIVVPAAPKFEEPGCSRLRDGDQFNGSFGVDGNRLLVRSDRYLYAIGGK